MNGTCIVVRSRRRRATPQTRWRLHNRQIIGDHLRQRPVIETAFGMVSPQVVSRSHCSPYKISLEAWQESYRENNDGAEWDIADNTSDAELEVTAKVMVEEFMSTLTDKDRRILELRMQGVTLEEIADRLGYANHSGVLKRIRKIGQAYEKFAGVDYGFTEKKII